jgi:hypothetical protein
MEVNIYIGFGTLKVKCTQYGICVQVAFKNARGRIFSEPGGRAADSGRVQEISGPVFGRVPKMVGALPLTEYAPPEKFVGGYLTSSVDFSTVV